MNSNKMERLSDLFEKMVDEKANYAEKYELEHLYNEYINDGRTEGVKSSRLKSRARLVNFN